MIQIFKDKNSWNDFVLKRPELGFTFLYEWMEVWQEAMGYELFPLADLEDGEIKSIFPLTYNPQKKIFFSSPFGGIGGASDRSENESYLIFIKKFLIDSDTCGIEIYPLSLQKETAVYNKYGYNTSLITTDYILNLNDYKNFEDILMRKISSKRRRSYRMAIKISSIIKRESSVQNIHVIYNFYRSVLDFKNEKNILQEKIFLKIAEKFKDQIIIFLAEYNSRLIGGSINIIFNKTITPWFIVSLPEYRNVGVSNGLYGELIRFAKDNNYEMIDWGPASPYGRESEIKIGFGGGPVSRIRAIKRLRLKDSAMIFVKGKIFKIMNRFPYLWRLWK